MVHRMPIPTKLLGFLFAVVASLPALAQSDRGAINGTVIDQNGAAVRRAKVTVVNLDSGASREVTTTTASCTKTCGMKRSTPISISTV
jgi:hypothetical protein